MVIFSWLYKPVSWIPAWMIPGKLRTNAQIKYIPQIAGGLFLFIALFSFGSLFNFANVVLGLPDFAAYGLVFLIIGLPALFLFGLGTTRKRFILTLGMVMMGGIFLMLFILPAFA